MSYAKLLGNGNSPKSQNNNSLLVPTSETTASATEPTGEASWWTRRIYGTADNKLLKASMNGDLSGVKEAFRQGANVEAVRTDDKNSKTSLMWACQKGHLEIVRELIGHGANVNAAQKGSGMTSLMLASAWGELEIVRELLGQGANVNTAETINGWTSLNYASSLGRLEVVRELLGRGVDVNAVDTWTGDTIIMLASQGGHLDVVKLLCSNGADPLMKNKRGENAIDISKKSDIRIFLESGCKAKEGGKSIKRKKTRRMNGKKKSHKRR